MRVTVFGASGKIGRLVVDRLLDDGNDVVAYVRNPAGIQWTHPRLTVVVGELSATTSIRQAVNGSAAVISTLGPTHKRGTSGTAITDGTRAVVAAMDDQGVRRYIGLATPSVPDRRDGRTMRAMLQPLIARVLYPGALREIRGMTAAVTGSDLDWTIARITNPVDRPGTGTLRVGYLGRDKIFATMTRTDIAAFLIAQLTDSTFVHAAPAISN
jgi:putative NADH-flavin reductase